MTDKATVESFKELMKIKVRRDIAARGRRLAREMETCGNLTFDQIVTKADTIISEQVNQYDLQNEPVDPRPDRCSGWRGCPWAA